MPTKENFAQSPLQAGFARADITPDYSICLDGYGAFERRRIKGARDPICMTCIALSQNGKTALLYTMDNCGCDNELSEEFSVEVTRQLGIPYEDIFFGATHSHSCPIIRYEDEGSKTYRAWIPHVCAQLAKEAIADLAPAAVYAARQNHEDMAFVRHYVHADGQFSGSNFNEELDKATIVGYAAEKLSELSVIQFRREGKQAILLVNWHVHPDHAAANGFRMISADIPGALRSKLEKESGMLVAYFTGASGNQVPSSWIPADDPGLGMEPYGQEMADRVSRLLPSLSLTEGGSLRWMKKKVTLDYDHTWDPYIPQAERVMKVWQEDNRDTATVLAVQLGLTSAFHADFVIKKAARPKQTQVTIGAIAFAGVGVTNSPFEMFGVTGADIKARSPFENTILISGNDTYIPHREAFAYRCYEADTSMWAPGTAERIADTLVTMLKELT